MPKLISSRCSDITHTVELTQDEVRLLFAACNLTESRMINREAGKSYGDMAAWMLLLMEQRSLPQLASS